MHEKPNWVVIKVAVIFEAGRFFFFQPLKILQGNTHSHIKNLRVTNFPVTQMKISLKQWAARLLRITHLVMCLTILKFKFMARSQKANNKLAKKCNKFVSLNILFCSSKITKHCSLRSVLKDSWECIEIKRENNECT